MLQRLHRTLGSFPSMGTATSGISRSTLRPMRFPAPVSLGTIKPKLACSVDSEAKMAPLAMSLEDACKTIDKLLKSDPDQKKDPSPQIQKLVDELSPAGVLKAFGNARQLPKRVYTLDELRMNNISPEMLLSPKDYSLNYTRNVSQAAAAAGFVAFAYLNHLDAQQVLATMFGITFLFVVDQVANYGGGEGLIIDTLARVIQPKYKERVAFHEAGHFLIAYLVGIMPRAYTLSSLDAFTSYKALNIQAGTQFCDSEFTKEMQSGKMTSTTLSRFSCVALAGVVTEYLRFEEAEGGVGDIQQLDGLFKSLGFTQKKADSEVRWSVLNVAMMLRRHEDLHDKLAEAMDRKASVGDLVQLIETSLAACDDV